MNSFPIQEKVDINPSYEWTEEAQVLNISHRELEVFALVTEGYKNREIAQILKIKHQSVKTHMHNFKKRLGARNNTQALVLALHLKLIKLRITAPYKEFPVIEMTSEDYIDGFRKLIAGEENPAGVSEKTKHEMKVWLKEHGIDPYNW